MATTTITEQELNALIADNSTIRLVGVSDHRSPLPASSTASGTAAQVESRNPQNWPTGRRGIPNYRPIDKTRTREERPNGESVPEQIFLTLMFTGVFTNATLSKAWNATGRPLFPKLFNYAIGGEW